MKITLMGIREYARHRGVTQSAVLDAIRHGKITEAVVMKRGRKKIDHKKADQLWSQNTSINNRNAYDKVWETYNFKIHCRW